jgi:hypothetical protein
MWSCRPAETIRGNCGTGIRVAWPSWASRNLIARLAGRAVWRPARARPPPVRVHDRAARAAARPGPLSRARPRCSDREPRPRRRGGNGEGYSDDLPCSGGQASGVLGQQSDPRPVQITHFALKDPARVALDLRAPRRRTNRCARPAKHPRSPTAVERVGDSDPSRRGGRLRAIREAGRPEVRRHGERPSR